ncbi:Hypothetical protein SRAE_1000188800 [Strongyloides ratti]|uniref:Uncharacterized protein n=1 Tax=Strongyloides ratti TaxID=34506 RepID=A0A090L678_STRRB|nr:Hypothetical protein SRAE_1000188800 [Strongyloides ratti]CEF63628.1 Hypothetical protein SRAE_1000188800 [Strongyloides ratti]
MIQFWMILHIYILYSYILSIFIFFNFILSKMGQKQSYQLDSPNRKEIAQKADLPDFPLKEEPKNSPVRLTISKKSLEKENLDVDIDIKPIKNDTNNEKHEEISLCSEDEDNTTKISDNITTIYDDEKVEKDKIKDQNDNEIIKLNKVPSLEQVPFIPEPLEPSNNPPTLSTPKNQVIMAI